MRFIFFYFLLFFSSYVLGGALEHKDSMGNIETIERGAVQFTTAGTGIQHSEYNHNHNEWVHFLQIWVKPNQLNLKPRYATGHFTDQQKLNTLCPIITPDGKENTIKINNDFRMYASILQPNQSVNHKLYTNTIRKAYIHVPILPNSGGVTVSGILGNTDNTVTDTVKLEPGDGAFIENIKEITITGIGKENMPNNDDRKSEFVLFDFAN